MTFDRAELRKRAEEAMKGEWDWGTFGNDVGVLAWDDMPFCRMRVSEESYDQCLNDAQYIAAAQPSTVLALLDRIEELEGAVRDADVELLEAADKFNVIHHNHPGKAVSTYQEQDKQFCATLSDRMMAAHSRARKALSGEKP